MRDEIQKDEDLQVPVLELKDVSISMMKGAKRHKTLVKHINLTIQPGELAGLVGESGSGKSLTASAIMGLLPHHIQVTDGLINFRGKKLNQVGSEERRSLRGKQMSLVFQDYQGSLTPFTKIGKQMVETIRYHEKRTAKEARELALDALRDVKLPDQRVFDSYPFQLSGGQRQRVAFAMAMMLRPALLIADEPTTALDVVTQHQVLDLLSDLQQETKCAVLLISHDLNQVLKRTNRIAIMYGGQILEEGPTEAFEQNSRHPYSRLLMKSRSSLAYLPSRLSTIPGEPGMISEDGCTFALRCPYKTGECLNSPVMTNLGYGHKVACNLIKENEGESIYREYPIGSEKSYKIL
jgi:oligopeptide/dipeptide ABC transporter ATP-binding protein